MLVPLIFQRAPHLTAALLKRSQPCLFSFLGCWGRGFPQPRPRLGAGQGWLTLGVVSAPGCDACPLPWCSLVGAGVTTASAHGTGHWRMAQGTQHMAHGAWHKARGIWHVVHGKRHMARGARHMAHGTRHKARWHVVHGTRHTAQGTQHMAHSTWHASTSHSAATPPTSKGVSRLSPRLPSRVLLDIKALGKLNCLQSTVCASALCLLWENTPPPRLCGCAILLSFPRNACSKAAAAPRCRDQPQRRQHQSASDPAAASTWQGTQRGLVRVACWEGCSASHIPSPPLWRAHGCWVLAVGGTGAARGGAGCVGVATRLAAPRPAAPQAPATRQQTK